MKRFNNLIKTPVKAALVLGFVFAMTVVPFVARGQIVSNTLANLATGLTLSIDDKVFSGFTYQATGLTGFNASQILVTAFQSGGVDYLSWSGNMGLTSSGIATGDLLLHYIVTANPGSISMIDQSYIPDVSGGLLAIDETAALGAFGGTVVGYSHLEIGDITDPPGEPVQGDNLNISPAQSVLYVTKDISFGVLSANGGTVSISQVEQSFHQVPEPGTTALALMGGLVLAGWTVRRRQSTP
ncbi:MAG TPA: PEP-CTERM sorting domain-containing protein [Candidatus Acidoferrum sp.]|nr:PEP-CTERM sorting domain-containing protein [Candidatus Acidoferrum sp.]